MKKRNENRYIFTWAAVGMAALIIILVSLFSPARAADWAVGGLIESNHYGSEAAVNEDHSDSLYGCIEWFCAGRYENSYSTPEKRRISRFAGFRYLLTSWHGLDFEAMGGFVDGYKGVRTDDQIIPFAGLSLRYNIVKAWQLGKVTAYGWEFNSRDWQ